MKTIEKTTDRIKAEDNPTVLKGLLYIAIFAGLYSVYELYQGREVEPFTLAFCLTIPPILLGFSLPKTVITITKLYMDIDRIYLFRKTSRRYPMSEINGLELMPSNGIKSSKVFTLTLLTESKQVRIISGVTSQNSKKSRKSIEELASFIEYNK